VVCYYDQLPRAHGDSRWTTTKMVKLAVDSLIQFSSMPLRACTFGGIAVALMGVLYAAVLIGRGIAGVSTPSGWPTLLVVVLVLGGTQLIVVGIVGEYLWRAVEQVRGRPLFVVRSRHFRAAGVVSTPPLDAGPDRETE
jgi:dolichol-phosphate mannosyltransferase